MEVSATERGLVRLFAVDLPADEIETFRTPDTNEDGDLVAWPLKAALGASYLDEDFIELFPVRDLEELGLRGYMVQGLGIAEADVAEDALRLDAVKGSVLVILSNAFGGFAETLAPRAPLRWIGTYKEETAPVTFAPLPSDAARGVVETPGPAKSNPHLTLLWAILALPVAALLIGVILFLLLT